MSDPSRGQRQQHAKTQPPPAEKFAPPAEPPPAEPRHSSTETQRETQQAEIQAAAETARATARQPALAMEALIATAGANGERNIAIEWIPVPMPNAVPVRFNVRTASGNPLEVVLEQLAYRRSHEGTGAVQTSITPVAPIGTPGRVIARDIATGEIVIQPWKWRQLGGGGGGGGFFEWLKQLFWKSS
jgi:hypothetical protein